MKDSYGNVNGCITEKKGILYAVIYIYQIDNGKKIRKSIWKSTKLPDNMRNRKKAEQLLNEWMFEYSNGHLAVDININMSDYVKRYLESNKRDWADTTYSGYFNRGKYITEFFSDVRVRDISVKDINDFFDYLLNGGRIKSIKSNKKGLSLRTVKDIKAFLNMVLCQAKDEGIIPKNPAEQATLSKRLVRTDEYTKEEDLFFSYEECVRFLELCKGHELYELFYFTMYFGLRRSEVLGLKWENIDLDKAELSIISTVTKGTGINRENSVKTKSSNRTYPLSQRQCEILAQIKQRQTDNKKIFGQDYIDSDYVFTHTDGSLYYPDYPTKAFKKIIKKDLTLPQGIHFHGLRASCVSLLVKQGFEIKQIQEWVGHSDIATTQKYYLKIKSAESKREVSNKMDNLIAI